MSINRTIVSCVISSDNCEEVFGDLQSRLDALSSENTELRTMLKDLQDLPGVVKALQSQVESLSKDLSFVMHGTTGNYSDT